MRKIKIIIKKIFWYIFRICKIDNKKIVIECFNGRGYIDNPKLIADELYKIDNSFKIVCMVSYDEYDDISLPNYVKKVKMYSIRAIYEHVTAKLWISNARKCYFIAKRKGQIYIQAWHGGIGAKKAEKDVESSLNPEYVRFAKKDAKISDYMIVSSKWQKEVFERSFWFNGNYIEYGWPMYDKFFKLENKDEIDNKYRKLFNISKDKKILLYCPTFRDDYSFKYYDLNFDKLINLLSEKDKTEWVVLIKLHPNMVGKADNFAYSDNIIDASFVRNMDELEIFSDLMITDYSSTMFDFAIMKKPCFIYANDYEEYIKQRNFNLSYDQMPFPISKSQTELENNIINFDNDKYINELDDYLNELGLIINLHSSKDIANFIVEKVIK